MKHMTRESRQWQEPVGVSRRGLITAVGSALFLAGCAKPSDRSVASTPTTSTESQRGTTVSSLLATSPFLIAHRGSGDNWPEHTMAAYEGAINSGAGAIEVSVCATQDGVLVCHHDTNTLRMTGVDLDIAATDYGRLSLLKNDARSWIGPGVGLEPIPRLKDVLDRFAGSHVIFIEDKQGTNTGPLLDLMDSYPDATEHFVWKQTAAGSAYEQASSRGYRTWGYFVDNTDDQFSRFAPNFDLVGIYHGASDQEIEDLVAFGKPVICWEIHTRWMRERVLALGVTGLMCSNYPYVAAAAASAMRDTFGDGVRAAGDLPWVLGLKYQPEFLTGERALRMSHDTSAGYLMGSLGPMPAEAAGINFELRWPNGLPGRHGAAGVCFGLADDQPYRAGIAGPTGGYQLLLRASGAVELYRRDPGVPEGTEADTLLVSFATAVPAPGEWTTLRIVSSPQEITVKRDGQPDWSASVPDSTYRGGYLGLLKGYKDPVPVDFRSVGVVV